MSKEQLRKEIAQQVKDYLAGGGEIEKVPRIQFCPDSMQWARERGYDYTSWDHIGEWNHGRPEKNHGR